MLNTLQIINLILVIFVGAAQVFSIIIAPSRKKRQEQKTQDEKEKIRKENQAETDRCVLRNIITDFYYRNVSSCEMKQYQYENLSKVYHQYKKLGGNSFIDKIWEEIQEWRIIQ